MVDAAAAVGSGGTPTAPVAAFSGAPTSGFFPLYVQFTDASTGSPTSWSWDFGDGATSNSQNPSHTYTAAGTYDVTLTASNAQGSNVATRITYINVNDPANTFASLPYSTGFETGALDQYWTVSEGVEGRIQVTTANGPRSGSYHLTMDDRVNGRSYSLNEAWMQLNLSGESQVDLDFWYKEFGDATHAQDGVFFSDDGGTSFVEVYDIAGQSTSNNSWINVALDVDALAASNGLNFNSNFVVKFQQYDNYGITTDGFAFDDISVTTGGGGGIWQTITYDDFEGGMGNYKDGGTWKTVKKFAKGIDFDNGVFYEATVEIPAGTYNYPSNAKLRFMCDASGNRDDVYIDAITFRGLTPSGNAADFADGRTAIPQRFSLGQNRPNPFNPITQIEFALPQAERVRVVVFDLRGRRVATLADRSFQPGVHQLRWDASQVASGVYFYQIQAGSFQKTMKMTLVK